MKRVLGMVLALVSMGFVVGAEAKAADISHQNTSVNANATPEPQWNRDRYGRRYGRRYDRRWGRTRTVRRSRVVRYGRRLYRETYAITYLPSGRYSTRLISRYRIG